MQITVAILKNREDAEDVLQEAVRRVLVRNRTLPSPDQVRMYLGRAIGNTALELYKNRKRERRTHMPICEHLFLPSNTSRPDAFLDEHEKSRERDQRLHLLHQGLKRLPEKQYEALRLTILDSQGSSIRDAGASNGIPYSTLRHRSKQGLRMLRRYVERGMRQCLTEKSGGSKSPAQNRGATRPKRELQAPKLPRLHKN